MHNRDSKRLLLSCYSIIYKALLVVYRKHHSRCGQCCYTYFDSHLKITQWAVIALFSVNKQKAVQRRVFTAVILCNVPKIFLIWCRSLIFLSVKVKSLSAGPVHSSTLLSFHKVHIFAFPNWSLCLWPETFKVNEMQLFIFFDT